MARRNYLDDRLSSTCQDDGPSRKRRLHLLVHVFEDLSGGQWSDFRRFLKWISHFQRFHLFHKAPFKIIVDNCANDKALGGDARLAIVDGARFYRSRYGLIEIRRRHNEERIATAQLQNSLLDFAAGDGGNAAAGRFAASECGGSHATIS